MLTVNNNLLLIIITELLASDKLQALAVGGHICTTTHQSSINEEHQFLDFKIKNWQFHAFFFYLFLPFQRPTSCHHCPSALNLNNRYMQALKTTIGDKKCILSLTDAFTKYVELVVTPSKEAGVIAKAIFNR